MALLRDLVNININNDVVKIQGVTIPVVFTMESFPYLEEVYGHSYDVFEADLNALLSQKKFNLGSKEIKLMYSLIYAMVRAGGTECTFDELKMSIGFGDLVGVFETALVIFTNQTFQQSDIKKIKPTSDGKK